MNVVSMLLGSRASPAEQSLDSSDTLLSRNWGHFWHASPDLRPDLPTPRTPPGITALILANSFGHADVVRKLRKTGTALGIMGDVGETALMHASAYSHLEVMDPLPAR